MSRFLHLVLDWVQDHVDPEQWEAVRDEIFSPADGVDPDVVDASVVEDEMALFNSFARQNKALGG